MAGVNIKSTNEYTADGNYLKSTTDASNYTTLYNFDLTKGLLKDVTDPNGNKVAYEYDPVTDRITTASSIQMPGIVNSYEYTGDDLTSITHNGFDYRFNYDKLGNLSDVSAAGQNLITNAYDLRKGLLSSSTYGNGQKKDFIYDAGNRLVEELSDGISHFVYSYDAKGNLAQVGDRKTGLYVKNVFDFSGKLLNTYDSLGWNSYFGYDKAGKLTKIEENFENNKYITSYEYGDFKNLTKVLFGADSSVTYDYNENGESNTIGRLNSVSVKAGNTNVLTSKFFYQAGVQSYTSNRISLVDNNGKTIAYTYYPNGNIETITENGKIIKYYYDAVNQLTREDNAALNKTITYEYDNGGNLQAKKEYDYTTETAISAEPTYEYKYTYDEVWKDKLTSFADKLISYDSIGNPLSYNGWSFTWDRGRELSSMVNTTSGQALSFTYNENGIRTSKTVNGVTTTYHLLGNVVTYEKTGDDIIHYTYSAGGSLLSMNYKNAEYYYVRNAQGDIIGLLNSDEVQVASYTYDSWGKLISIKDQNGNDITNDTTHIGYKNPYRYRGYRYDSETGLYYLQSRYYNPEWGRFINADGLIGQAGDLLGHNLFTYSINNPVNMSDPNGFRPIYSATISDETDQMRKAALAEMAVIARNNIQNLSTTSGSSDFNYQSSLIKGTLSGATDEIGQVIAGKLIKEKKVWIDLEKFALGTYGSNLSRGAKIGKKALGMLGATVLIAWDVGGSLSKGEYVGAGIDILSGAVGVGAGWLIGVGGAAAIAAGAPALLIGAVGFGVAVGAGVAIDKISSGIKDRYYGR